MILVSPEGVKCQNTGEIKPSMPSVKNGIFWYRNESEFNRLRELMDDKDNIARSYGEWLKAAEELLDSGPQRGILFTKIKADPDDFIRWCNVNSHRLDFKARRLYAAQKVCEIFGNG